MEHRNEGQAIDLHDEEHDSGGQVDASVYTLAAVFGPVALPAGMPDYQKAAILDHAEQDRDAAGDLVIDNRINPDDPRRRQARADADDDDNLSQLAQIVRQERAEREREGWAHTRSTVGNVTMTGAEWAQFAERLRNDQDLRRRLIEVFEKDGATREEAEHRVDRAAEAAEASSVPPGQRDERQRSLLADAQIKADLENGASLSSRDEEPKHSAASLSGRFETAVTQPASPEITTAARPPRPVVIIAPGPAF